LAEALKRASSGPFAGRRVKAVLPVHLRGDVCDLPVLRELAAGAGAVLVEDAPHALGSVAKFDGVAHPVGDGAYLQLSPASRSIRSRPWPPARAAC
jgi:dTDP-4-amino-4,6-dideoxygalactose transaminase